MMNGNHYDKPDSRTEIIVKDATIKFEQSTSTSEQVHWLLRWAPSIVAFIAALGGIFGAWYTATTQAQIEATKAQLQVKVAGDQIAAELEKIRAEIRIATFSKAMEVMASVADKEFMVAAPALLGLCVQAEDKEIRKMSFAALTIWSYTCDDVCTAREKQRRKDTQSCYTACESLKATIKTAEKEGLSGCASVAPPAE
jgi:hypothetical protein